MTVKLFVRPASGGGESETLSSPTRMAVFANGNRSLERPGMGRISFTANLRRHVSCPTVEVRAATLREAMDAVLADNPRLRPYLLDEHGRLRRHVNVFINDLMISDRVGLSDRLAPEDEIYVFQALSGG